MKLTVTVITRNESAHIAAALQSVAWADEIVVVDSAAPTTPSRSRGGTRDAGGGARLARLQRAEELRRGAARRTTGFCRSTPTSASRRSSAPRSGRCSRREPAARGYRVPRVTPLSRPLDPLDRLVSGLPAAPVRSPRRPVERPPRARVGRACSGDARAGSAPRAAALPLSRHLATTSRRSIATRRWRPSSGSPRAAGRTRFEAVAAPAAGVPPQLHPARRLQGRRRRPARVGAELVLRLPEAREAVGAAARAPSRSRHRRSANRSRRSAVAIDTRADVLAAHRHGADVARRAEPGARHGAGPARARAPDDARRALRRASCGSARRKGSTSIPLAPKTEMDLSAAWRLSRVIKQLRPDIVHAHDPARRGDGGAGAVDEHAAREAAAGRGAARRLPPRGQRALALEVPAGGLLHLRVGGDPQDARRRRRARRARR